MKQMKQENHLFEYAVIRAVPHVEREEFVNVGVILFCARLKFLKTRIRLNEVKVKALCEQIDLEELKEHVLSFERVCKGGTDGGPIGKLSLAERFRWLTATRSTVLQTSKVHPGLCPDPDEMLERLFNQLVV
jgi:hypothetical protein